MNSDRLRTALFVTALLRTRRDLDCRTRTRVISSVKPFDIYSRTDAIDGLDSSFREAGLGQGSQRGLTKRSLRNAAAMAEEWLNQGVLAVTRQEILSTAEELHHISPLLFARGDVHVSGRPVAAVLNSRQPRSARPENHWINNTKFMVTRALKRGFVVASSYGPLPYCIVCLLAKGSPIIVVCDAVLPFMQSREVLDQFLERYGDLFDLERTLFISPFPPGQVPSAASRSAERDHLVAALSSVVMAGEIRPGGIMESVVETVAKRRVSIEHLTPQTSETISKAGFGQNEPLNDDRSSLAPAEYNQTRLTRSVSDERVSRNARHVKGNPTTCPIERRPTPSDKGVSVPFADQRGRQSSYLVHYTRSWPGPWPGQSLAEYCQSLVSERPNAGHSAFDTLARILGEGLILGSRRLNRCGFSVTCFTECLPSELRSLVEWRRGLIRWSFEPYGLAFRKSTMFDFGARPVIYAVEQAFDDLSEDLKYLFQLQNPDGKQWSFEREWRMRGNVRLADFDQDEVFVIVRTVAEAEIVAKEFGYATALAGI